MSNPGRSGYVGGPEIWREFLACWDHEILESVELEGAVSSMERQVLARGGQSNRPADPEFDGIYSEDQLQVTCTDRGLIESS